MTAATASRAPKKPRPKPERKVSVIERPNPADPEGWFVVQVAEGTKTDLYLVGAVPCDLGTLAFRVEKLDAELNPVKVHHATIGDPAECSCDCEWATLGKFHEKPCRHVAGLLELQERGQLPRPARQKHAACNRCQERTDAPGLCERCQHEADQEDFAEWCAAQAAMVPDPTEADYEACEPPPF